MHRKSNEGALAAAQAGSRRPSKLKKCSLQDAKFLKFSNFADRKLAAVQFLAHWQHFLVAGIDILGKNSMHERPSFPTPPLWTIFQINGAPTANM